MLRQVAVGGVIFALCVALSCLGDAGRRTGVLQPRLARTAKSAALVSTMVAVVCTLALAHLAEVMSAPATS